MISQLSQQPLGKTEIICPESNGRSMLGIRFNLSGDELQIYHPDGTKFCSYVETNRTRK
jgi:hypothetical protein